MAHVAAVPNSMIWLQSGRRCFIPPYTPTPPSLIASIRVACQYARYIKIELQPASWAKIGHAGMLSRWPLYTGNLAVARGMHRMRMVQANVQVFVSLHCCQLARQRWVPTPYITVLPNMPVLTQLGIKSLGLLQNLNFNCRIHNSP